MAKRKLSHKQQQRIRHKQATLLDSDQQENGRVVARYARHVDVRPENGDETLRCHVRANIDSIAVGDYVAFSRDPDGKAVVVAVEPRRTVIERPDGLGRLKPVAANIDQIFIVLAPQPEPHATLLDRYLLAAENANIPAAIVINKIDTDEMAEPFEALLAIYRKLNYPVFIVSCYRQTGFDQLRDELAGKTSVFVGQSGVGKSSIINTLLPEAELRTGALSGHVTKGRHTTTTATLFELPEGGNLIDSPGIREFHLDHIDREQVFAGFRELQPAIGHCRFRNCSHEQEPGCAVQAVIECGQMHPSRAQSLDYILHAQA